MKDVDSVIEKVRGNIVEVVRTEIEGLIEEKEERDKEKEKRDRELFKEILRLDLYLTIISFGLLFGDYWLLGLIGIVIFGRKAIRGF